VKTIDGASGPAVCSNIFDCIAVQSCEWNLILESWVFASLHLIRYPEATINAWTLNEPWSRTSWLMSASWSHRTIGVHFSGRCLLQPASTTLCKQRKQFRCITEYHYFPIYSSSFSANIGSHTIISAAIVEVLPPVAPQIKNHLFGSRKFSWLVYSSGSDVYRIYRQKMAEHAGNCVVTATRTLPTTANRDNLSYWSRFRLGGLVKNRFSPGLFKHIVQRHMETWRIDPTVIYSERLWPPWAHFILLYRQNLNSAMYVVSYSILSPVFEQNGFFHWIKCMVPGGMVHLFVNGRKSSQVLY